MVTSAESSRRDDVLSCHKGRSVEEDSWTEVERQELDHATSYVSDSMYLVMENPVQALYVGETVQIKVHAVCDSSRWGQVARLSKRAKLAKNGHDVLHGTLFITNYRVLFRSFQQHAEEELIQIHLHNIAELAEASVSGKERGPTSQLDISCKNFEMLNFQFPGKAVSGEVYVQLSQLLARALEPAAFATSTPPFVPSGWHVFDVEAELARLGFPLPKQGVPLSGFRITHVNRTYQVAPTYPNAFIVPAVVSDGELRKISGFRARGRVPAVTYRHVNGALVARCAQPMVGLRRKRCPADEAYVAALGRECPGQLVVVDCRSQASAYGNIALGGGFEVIEYYHDTRILFMGIENIHSMRDSIRKLFDLIKHEVRGNERPNWLSCLESTRWLEHVRSILVSCSICVAQLVEGTSFLIHCSDGWDRTAQITALVKLCADPFYRTRKGFQVLIEQEWCAFGHQFRVRSGRPGSQAGYWEDESTSPVFLQFIDAVWQLMRQFPCSFEFSERFLIALVDEVYCKQSGTFVDDCEERRMRSKTFLRCHSAWTVLESHRDAADFHNPFYVVPRNAAGPSDKAPTVLECKWHTSSVAIWSSFYLRSLESNESRVYQDAWAKEVQVTQRELQHELSAAQHELRSQVEQNSDLQSEVEQLKRERAQLHRLLEGEVYSDTLNGLLVHEEEDENEDGVLLSVTPMSSTSRSLLEGAEDCSMTLTGGVGCFLGAAMSQDFEIVHTYFDPSRQEAKRMKTPTTCHDLFPSRQRVSMEEVVR